MNQKSNYFTSLAKAIITLFGENVHLERVSLFKVAILINPME